MAAANDAAAGATTGAGDAASIIMALEGLGFCKPGEGGPFVQSGAIRRDGDLPVNTHGGLLSEAYIHGFNHVIEAVEQLRGPLLEDKVIDFIAEMPRDPNGKLYKRKLRDPYWAGRDRAI